jgi:hypothetical protein
MRKSERRFESASLPSRRNASPKGTSGDQEGEGPPERSRLRGFGGGASDPSQTAERSPAMRPRVRTDVAPELGIPVTPERRPHAPRAPRSMKVSGSATYRDDADLGPHFHGRAVGPESRSPRLRCAPLGLNGSQIRMQASPLWHSGHLPRCGRALARTLAPIARLSGFPPAARRGRRTARDPSSGLEPLFPARSTRNLAPLAVCSLAIGSDTSSAQALGAPTRAARRKKSRTSLVLCLASRGAASRAPASQGCMPGGRAGRQPLGWTLPRRSHG